MRRILSALLIAVSTAMVAQADPLNKTSHGNQPMLKAVFHVNFADAERHEHGLKNIDNILQEAADSQIEVVCHGEGIKLVEKNHTKQSDLIQALMKKGVRFVACENTMKKKSLGKDDLVVGTAMVPSGAVEVIRKQSEGFGYFRP